ncbi:MAG: CBS domain-containing protein [archaeon]|nr:CBS domain-containing protein [archaeon]
MTSPIDEDTVANYMVRDVVSISLNTTVKEAIEKVIHSNFYGFPVTERGYLSGFVTSKELLRYVNRPDATMRDVMKGGTVVYAVPSMKISDATRVLFRYGIRNLPVVDNNRKLIGIISNIDIVRSQIEKIRPSKVTSIKSFLESYNDIKIKIMTMDIPMTQILPSQKEVYMDELIGRQYEIEKGLFEPLIVVKRRKGYLIVDGHHRAMAAIRLGIKKSKAIVLEPDDLDVCLGLEKTAEKWGVHTLNDIKIVEGSKHPFIRVTLPNEEASSINKRLEDTANDV